MHVSLIFSQPKTNVTVPIKLFIRKIRSTVPSPDEPHADTRHDNNGEPNSSVILAQCTRYLHTATARQGGGGRRRQHSGGNSDVQPD